MADDVFREGDRITLVKGAKGWRIEMAVAKGGLIAPGSADIHADPETAINRLREMAAQLSRRVA